MEKKHSLGYARKINDEIRSKESLFHEPYHSLGRRAFVLNTYTQKPYGSEEFGEQIIGVMGQSTLI